MISGIIGRVTVRTIMRWLAALVVANTAIGLPAPAQAHDIIHHSQAAPDAVSFDQQLGEHVPHDLAFRDDQDVSVTLGQYLGERPVLLALTYFNCTTLCPLVRQGLVEALRPMALTPGDEFDVVIVSIDPTEGVKDAAAAKAESLARYERAESAPGWHFLTGDHTTIDQLADAIGFRYVYDERQEEYAHASGLVLLTPEGQIARYFYGIEYNPRDLRLGLVEASAARIGNPVDQLLLLCYHYDPVIGQYSMAVLTLVRTFGLMTVAGIGAMILILRRKESSRMRQV